MPDTAERDLAVSDAAGVARDPAGILNLPLGWQHPETPLPVTVLVDGATEAALTGRTAVLSFPDYPVASPNATLIISSARPPMQLSETVTASWVESLTRAADPTRARLQLMREAIRFALREHGGTRLSMEPVRTVRSSPPITLTALRAAQEIKSWLQTSWDSVANAAGVNPGTIHYWQAHPVATPRPSTVSDLYRLHASLAAARRFLGTDAGFDEWLQLGSAAGASPRDLALAGDVENLRQTVQSLVFAEAAAATPPPSRVFREELDEGSDESQRADVLRRKTNRRRRARLT